MENKTISEQLFENLCTIRDIKFEPIPRVKDFRTPDYRIWLKTTEEIIVEVKQMDLSKEDLHFIDHVRKGKEVPSGFRATGHIRIRNIITSAHSQLKNFSKGLYPAIIVIYDNTGGLSHLDHEDILNGMYGNETVVVNFSQAPDVASELVSHKFGGKQKLTPYHNRVVSAIALLTAENNSPKLNIFHNIYTELPVNPHIAWQIAEKQYTLQLDLSTYQFWSEITP